MSNGPDDRVKETGSQAEESLPRVYVTIDGENFMKLSMETYYGETSKQSDSSCSEHTEGGAVCSCNKVCTCNPQCSCQSHTACNPQCACQTVSNHGGGCSCNKVCSCVPVH
jgi:hypothetical protein